MSVIHNIDLLNSSCGYLQRTRLCFAHSARPLSTLMPFDVFDIRNPNERRCYNGLNTYGSQ